MESPTARAATTGAPCRYLVCLQGMAQARPNSPSSAIWNPIADLRADLSFVTGLEIPSDANPGPGGRPFGPFHPTIINPLTSGVRGLPKGASPQGVTSDQIVAAQFAGLTTFDSLAYRVQAQGYTGAHGAMSYRGTPGSRATPVTPIGSPRLAWEQLFSSFTPSGPSTPTTPTTPTGPTMAQRLLEEERSVLDLVSERANSLLGVVGVADRLRLEQHFDEIRALEQRLADLASTPGTGMGGGGGPAPTAGCAAVPDPGPDPASTAYAWSGETQRGQFFVELIAMAFACDLTRSISWMISDWQSHMSAREVVGADIDFHECTHTSDPNQQRWLEGVTQWHVDLYGQLLRRLKAIPEGSGTLLDSTVAVMLFEGEGSHAYNSNTSLVAGMPSVLRMGETINAGGAHPCQMLSSAMHAVGVEEDLGEVPGQIGGMFR